jgi:hypothetical protein
VSTKRMLAAVAAAVLMLGGCAEGTHPGAAAMVGGTEIGVGRVDEVSRSVTTALGQPFTTTVTLNELVRNEVVRQVAEQRSIRNSEAEVHEAMRAVVPQEEALKRFEADPVAREFLASVAGGVLTTAKLGGAKDLKDQSTEQAIQAGNQLVLEEAKKIDVSVSPRFGKWSGDRIAEVSGSLSVESPQTKKAREEREAQQQQQPQG